jgi:hypothetical protein
LEQQEGKERFFGVYLFIYFGSESVKKPSSGKGLRLKGCGESGLWW